MVHALGFSNGPFNPYRAGRLCRGRERWIEPWDPEPDENPTVHRLVISGAAFSDLSAADALRGVPHSQVDLTAIITSLFPRKKMLAFMEDGHPAAIPVEAQGVELYEGYRAGGRVQSALVRWWQPVSGVKDIRALLQEEVRGFAVLDGEVDHEALFEELFILVGMATLDSPPARFQPAALPELVKKVKALVLIHRDKHGPAVGIYSAEPIEIGTKLATLCEKADALLVPFAIPPMLARWDRALSELRDGWGEERPFPVPEPTGGYDWEARSRRRRGRKDRRDGIDGNDGDQGDDDTDEPTEASDDSEHDEPVEAPRARPKRGRERDRRPKKAVQASIDDDDLDFDDALLVEED